jgi:hypothetical protein
MYPTKRQNEVAKRRKGRGKLIKDLLASIKAKHIPYRTCIICRSKKTKPELIRIFYGNSKGITLDNTNKFGGRGAYVCKRDECHTHNLNKSRIELSLREEFTKGNWDQLREEISGKVICN